MQVGVVAFQELMHFEAHVQISLSGFRRFLVNSCAMITLLSISEI